MSQAFYQSRARASLKLARRLADDRWPQARQRLDFYHAVQHLAAVGRALFGEDKAKLTTWLKPLVKQLKNQSSIPVIRQLEEALARC